MSAAAVSSSLVSTDQQAQQSVTDIPPSSIDIKEPKSPPSASETTSSSTTTTSSSSSFSSSSSMMEQTAASASESSTTGQPPSLSLHSSSNRPSLPSSSNSLNSSSESASELMMDFEDDQSGCREEGAAGQAPPDSNNNHSNGQQCTSEYSAQASEDQNSTRTSVKDGNQQNDHQEQHSAESTSADRSSLSSVNNLNQKTSPSTLLVTSSSLFSASSNTVSSSASSVSTSSTSSNINSNSSQQTLLSRSTSLSSTPTSAPLLPRSNSSTSEQVKAETTELSLSTLSTLSVRPTLPVIRSLSVGVSQQSELSESHNNSSQSQSPAITGTTSTPTSAPVLAAPTGNSPSNVLLGMPSLLSSGQAPVTTQQENIRIGQPPPNNTTSNNSNNNSHSSVGNTTAPGATSHAMMDTYSQHHNHHHHSPGLAALTGPGPGGPHHNTGPHTPQTILSMTSPSLSGHSMSNVSVVTVASSSPSSDPKECIEEQCPVCGDRVSGYHYGLLTCESCKGFFKRTVQNKKVYTCVAERSCHIDKSQRKRCPYCRFQKCLEVGMKLEAVRADRMRGGRNKFGPMYKRDRARRLQILRQKQLTKAHHHLAGHHGGGGGHHHMNAHHHSPGATMLPGGELNFLQGAHGGHGHGHGGPHHTTLFDGVKQELIQIPQLSSSTSSPDSSPSPGSAAAAGVAGGLQGGPLSVAAAAAAAVAAGHGTGAHGGHANANGNAGGPPGGLHHPFMPNLSISAHPMTAQSNGGNSTANGGLMNPAAAAAAAAADHLLKSWANGSGSTGVAGTSKSSMSSYGSHDGQGTNSSGTMVPGSKYLPPLVREFQNSMIDDKEWQAQLFGLLQNQTYNQCEVDLFELMCKVIDQSLFSQVDWARNSIFFKELKVDDQMKLLQHAWSDMLVLDHIHQRMHVGLPDDSTLPNGQKFDLLSLALLGVPQVVDQLHRVTARLADIKVDPTDYICLKFLLLLNPDVRGLTNYKLVHEAHDQTKQALLEYTVNFYPQIGDKFQQLMALVPEIRALTLRGEDFLYYKHINGSAPTQTLLMEMLHAKKK